MRSSRPWSRSPRALAWPLAAIAALSADAAAQESAPASPPPAASPAEPAPEPAATNGEATQPAGSDPLLIPVGDTSAEAEIEALRNRIRALEEQFDALQAESVVDESEIPLDLETKVHGYADVTMRASRLMSPYTDAEGNVIQTSTHPPGFEIGDLVISYNANLDRKMYATVDLVYGLGHFGDPIALIDRIDLRYEVSDAFQITAGKFQSPFGFWNTNIAYGSYLYAPISRPIFLTFERHGAWLTTRQTGVDLHGELELGFARWGYHVGIGNGRSAQLAQTQDIGDGTSYKTTWVQLWYQTPGGIQVGITGMYDPLRMERATLDFNQDLGDQSDRVNDQPVDDKNPILTSNVDEYLILPHIAIQTSRLEILAEGALMFHKDEPDSELVLNRAGYVQAGYRFKDVMPYARGEFAEWWKDDPVFLDLNKLKTRPQATVGLRYDMALHAALKFEGTYIMETIYKNPDDPTYVDPMMEMDLIMENPNINEEYVDRFGGAVSLAVGF